MLRRVIGLLGHFVRACDLLLQSVGKLVVQPVVQFIECMEALGLGYGQLGLRLLEQLVVGLFEPLVNKAARAPVSPHNMLAGRILDAKLPRGVHDADTTLNLLDQLGSGLIRDASVRAPLKIESLTLHPFGPLIASFIFDFTLRILAHRVSLDFIRSGLFFR